jgi:tRNA-dihydrouridine synthase 1
VAVIGLFDSTSADNQNNLARANHILMLSRIAAPMVNQSELPFRTLVQRYDATLAYTQMLKSDALLNDQDYLEYHLRDLTMSPACPERPVVVQLCGNDPETVVRAGRKLQNYCNGIGMHFAQKSRAETALTL